MFCLYHFSGVLPAWAQPQGMLQWLSGPPMSSSRSTASSTFSRMPLNHFISSSTPVWPPSWLAPLSDMTTKTVLSKRPIDFRNSTRRPIWSSVCSSMAAKASCRRQANFCSFVAELGPGLHARIARREPGFGGITPSAFCRSNHSSRTTSQPASNLPRHFSR